MSALLKANKTSLVIDDQLVLTASGAEYTNYEFKKGTVTVQNSASATLTIAKVKESDAGSYTVVCTLPPAEEGADPTKETSPAVVIAVDKKTMTGVVVSFTPDSVNVKKGDSASVKATVTGAPTGSTFSYTWYDSDKKTETTTDTLSINTDVVGSKKIKVEVVVKASNYKDSTVSKEMTAVVGKMDMPDVTLSVTPTTKEVYIGDTLTLVASVSGAPQGAQVVYQWNEDGKAQVEGASYQVDTSAEKTGSVTLTALIKATDYEDDSVSTVVSYTVKPKPVPDINTAPDYIHPLDWRNTAYLWIGWWVMEEIQKAKEQGLDWKTQFDQLNYSKDLESLSIMFQNYEHVEVQESRNGYILDKDAIESGYIY